MTHGHELRVKGLLDGKQNRVEGSKMGKIGTIVIA